jgi:hypothetical protein
MQLFKGVSVRRRGWQAALGCVLGGAHTVACLGAQPVDQQCCRKRTSTACWSPSKPTCLEAQSVLPPYATAVHRLQVHGGWPWCMSFCVLTASDHASLICLWARPYCSVWLTALSDLPPLASGLSSVSMLSACFQALQQHQQTPGLASVSVLARACACVLCVRTQTCCACGGARILRLSRYCVVSTAP